MAGNKINFNYKTKGVCSVSIHVELENNVVKQVRFTGGCNGNLQGISKLVVGMPAKEVIEKLKSIRCGAKNTSCPDQLATALEEALKKSERSKQGD